MTDDPIIPIVFDCDLRRPACVLLQAAMGGNSSVSGPLFDAKTWLIAPTPGMHLYHMPLSHWRRVAETIREEMKS